MRVPGVVSVNLLSAHVARVDDVMSAWIRSGHGECADVRVEECGPGSISESGTEVPPPALFSHPV